MFLIIASRFDLAARQLVARWATQGATLLTPDDLSRAGWRWSSGDPRSSTLVASGQRLPAAEVTGVLTRLPGVYEQELEHIVPDDRAYVAAEMTAFLRAWLAELTCPVLNRPTATCLSGPAWRSEYWTATAARLGCAVVPVRRRTELDRPAALHEPSAPGLSVTVVGERCFGTADEVLSGQARQLATAAGVDLLGIQFERSQEATARFVGATLWPALTADAVADAVLRYLRVDSQPAHAQERTHP
jgi:hypothetical protein